MLAVKPHRLRHILFLLSLLAAEMVWVAMLSWVMGRTEAGGALGWLPLFVAASILLLLNHWLTTRLSVGLGHLLSLVVALLMTLLLMRFAAPQQVDLGAPHRAFLDAILGLRALGSPEQAPLTVIFLSGFILWWRTVATVNIMSQTISVRQVTTRMTYQLLWLMGIFLFGMQNVSFPPRAAFLFFGSALLALAFARAAEAGRVHRKLSVPFNGRWLATLLGALGVTLLLALLVGQILSFRTLQGLYDLLAPVRYLLLLMLTAVAHLLGAILLPLIRWLYSTLDPVEEQQAPSDEQAESLPESDLLDPAETPVVSEVVVGLFVVLVLLLLTLFIYYLYKNLYSPSEEEAPVEGEYDTAGGQWRPRDWLRERVGGLRDRFRRTPARTFGTDTVRDLYRNLLQFGDEHGLARPEEDTPYEYLIPLCERYPERRDDLFMLTDAYVSVRYGEQFFSPEDVRHLQRAWRRIAGEPRAAGAETDTGDEQS